MQLGCSNLGLWSAWSEMPQCPFILSAESQLLHMLCSLKQCTVLSVLSSQAELCIASRRGSNVSKCEQVKLWPYDQGY